MSETIPQTDQNYLEEEAERNGKIITQFVLCETSMFTGQHISCICMQLWFFSAFSLLPPV